MIDGRGRHKKKQGEITREKIVSFFEANPTAIQKEACEAIGITRVTLARHLKAIKANPRNETKGG